MSTKFSNVQALASVASAVCDNANINEDGSVNWNYVEADMYFDLNPESDADRRLIDLVLNQFADAFENSSTKNKPVRPNFA